MRCSLFCSLLAAASVLGTRDLRPRSYDTHDFYVIQFDSTAEPTEVAALLGLEYEGLLGELDGHHLFRATKQQGDIVADAVEEAKCRKGRRHGSLDTAPLENIRFHQKQEARKRLVKRGPAAQRVTGSLSQGKQGEGEGEGEGEEEGEEVEEAIPETRAAVAARQVVIDALDIHDPVFKDQWHLYNTVEAGNDLNVSGLWSEGITGKGSTVCIVDDGLDMDSNDLRDNYFRKGSYDYNDHVKDPKPRLVDDRHGTRCAGEVAAGKNDACGVGVAWNSRISGVRILSGSVADADDAMAMNYEFQENQIYSCSWGPMDDGKSMDAPGILIRRALINGVQKGRDGRGSIFVFAAGNGAAKDDDCNFDGYANSIYSVTVGAVDKQNTHPYYSEKCSAQLIVTYSSGVGDSIHTADVGTNRCSTTHGQTSAAAPLVAGIYALALEARPELTWRDIQWITVNTAVKLDTQSSDWQETPYGKHYSHRFGYGKVDAYTLVHAAKSWNLVKPQAWFFSSWVHVKHEIPQGEIGHASHCEVTADMLNQANLERLEHVTLITNVKHTRRGDLSVELRSPSGIISHLSTARRYDNYMGGYFNWTFMSVAHWGETGVGMWTVIVKDTNVNEHKGTVTDWKLQLWGECIDPAKQELLPMPEEADDNDDSHDAIGTRPTATDIAIPLTLSHPATPSDAPAATVSVTGSEEVEGMPSATPGESSLLAPSPTSGVKKPNQVLIYGSFALIAVFCCGMAGYLCYGRLKRLRNNSRSEYAFELVDGADDGDARGTTAALNGRKGTRRADQLYDAFPGESNEYCFSESEDGYRDHVDKEEEEACADGVDGGE